MFYCQCAETCGITTMELLLISVDMPCCVVSPFSGLKREMDFCEATWRQLKCDVASVFVCTLIGKNGEILSYFSRRIASKVECQSDQSKWNDSYIVIAHEAKCTIRDLKESPLAVQKCVLCSVRITKRWLSTKTDDLTARIQDSTALKKGGWDHRYLI